jgi:hypothetical protein
MLATEQIPLRNWPTFKVHATPARGLLVIRSERNGSRATKALPYRVKGVASRMNQEAAVSANSARLELLLDKLVAVQMDLEPVCGTGGERMPVVAARDAIASACSILHSAIADVRNIIHQIDGLTNLPEVASAQE